MTDQHTERLEPMSRISGFDSHNPPSPELLADCVHCGFCLPSCPTYVLWGEEMDSPRGRIHLMKNVTDGAPLDDTVVGHIDACLGCMACVTACPSGVQYDRLLEKAKMDVARGIIAGNLLAYGGHSSAKVADLVVDSFKDVEPNSMKGVKVLFIGQAADSERVKAAVAPAGVDYKFVEAK